MELSPTSHLGRLSRAVRSAARLAAMPLAVLITVTPLAAVPAAPAVAAENRRDGVTPSAADIERYYNPFGDPWAVHKAPNPFIPIGLTPGCHRREPHEDVAEPTDEQLTMLANSSCVIVPEECADIVDNDDELRALGSALKAKNPKLKYIGYLAPAYASVGPLNDASGRHPVGLREIVQDHEEWFVHKKGAAPTEANRVRNESLNLLDVTHPGYRAFMARKVAGSLESHNMGGVAVDGCHHEPRADNLKEISPATLRNWGQGCVELLKELKRQVGPDKLVFFLGYKDREFTKQRFAVSDGLLWEDPINAVSSDLRSRDEGYFERINWVMDDAKRAGDKYVGVWVNTNINGPGYSGQFRDTNRTLERGYARYYLAAYLQVLRGQKTPLLYYTPTRGSGQFHSQTFFRDWDLRIGNPTGKSREVMHGAEEFGSVYQRSFQHGEAVLNNSKAPYTVDLGRRPLVTADGTTRGITWNSTTKTFVYTMPPKSGMVFISRAQYAASR